MSEEKLRNPVKVAAVGDLHVHDKPTDGSLRTLFTEISNHAEVLALCGEFTTLGLPSEAENLASELRPVRFPLLRFGKS